VNKWIAYYFFNSILKIQHAPLSPKCYELKGTSQLLFFRCLHFWIRHWIHQGAWGCVTQDWMIFAQKLYFHIMKILNENFPNSMLHMLVIGPILHYIYSKFEKCTSFSCFIWKMIRIQSILKYVHYFMVRYLLLYYYVHHLHCTPFTCCKKLLNFNTYLKWKCINEKFKLH